jgi:predicted membrane protein
MFLAVEGMLAIAALYSIFHSRGLSVLGIVAFLAFIITMRRKTDMHRRGIGVLFVGIIVAVLLLSNIFIWLMLAVAILYFTLVANVSLDLSSKGKINDPEMIFVQAKEPTGTKSGKCIKTSWFGSERIGDDTYEWDDINIIKAAGDTIIDLGNTLLPKEDSVILIRKGIGRTRILVPTQVGVSFEHSTLAGVVKFEGQEYKLSNETLKVYSAEFDESTRKLRIISSTFLGEIEVIRT